MMIYFVRHGQPNYQQDILTPLGHAQAEAASKILVTYDIERIYSSTMGRAMETAAHTAEKLGLDIIPCDFIREISWKSRVDIPLPHGGHPWRLANQFLREGRDLREIDIATEEPFCQTKLPDTVKRVTEGIDTWLESLGYRREGAYYRNVGATCPSVAIFSHGGAATAALSHILNLPFVQAIQTLSLNFTSIIALNLVGEEGALVAPILTKMGAEHIHGLEADAECKM